MGISRSHFYSRNNSNPESLNSLLLAPEICIQRRPCVGGLDVRMARYVGEGEAMLTKCVRHVHYIQSWPPVFAPGISDDRRKQKKLALAW